ncbi:MAG TPA: protein kinase [Gemmatimonadaceae bacterium]
MTTSLIRLDSLADRYRIGREVGHGGMASVYLAHDLKHDRDVAIKVLHPELAAALGGDRFLAEIKTTARLQHPHILPLLDSGEADGHLFYVMPFVAGETLRGRLEREHLLPIDDALRIGREVADALEYAHNLGVVHRDIKPENILLQDGHALVADFGISLAVQQAGGARMTQTGLSLGTPQYMSPEQAMGERTIDGRSDIYSLAAVIYEMLAGDPPFTGSTVQAIVARVMTEKPPRIATRRERVPRHVEGAVLRGLEKLPADRWATAREFSEALGGAGAAWVAPEPEASSPSPRSAFRARPLLLAGGGVLALAAAWFAGRSMTRANGATPTTVTSILPPADGSFGEQQALALSPDGRQLAFVFSTTSGSQSLWLRSLDKLDAKPIPGSVGADIPFWSPDGRSLGFFAKGILRVVDPNGDIRQLCTVTRPVSASWGITGNILFGHRGGVSIVPASGGTCRLLVPAGNNIAPRAAFFPDGKRFVYSRGRAADLAVANENGQTIGTLAVRRSLLAVVAPNYLVYPDERDAGALDIRPFDLKTLAWTGPEARFLNGVRSRSGVHTFSVAAGALAYLPGTPDRSYLVVDASASTDSVPVEGTWTVSARNRRLGAPTIAVAGNLAGLWLYDLETKRSTRLLLRDSTITSLPSNGIGATYPAFSPDGKRIAYMANRYTQCGLSIHDLAADSNHVVTHDSLATADMLGCPLPMDWFPDGNRILVKRDTVLQIMALDGSIVGQIARPGRIFEGHLSPDGNRVAYASEETERAEVYVQAIPSGLPTRVSLDGGRWPGWADGGRSLYFMTPDGRIQKATINGTSLVGPPKTVMRVPEWRRNTFDDNGVGFAVVGDGERFIIRRSSSALGAAYAQNWRSLLTR